MAHPVRLRACRLSRPLHAVAIAIAAWLTLAGVPAVAAGGGQTKTEGPDHYLRLEALTASITQGFQAQGVLHVEAGLDIRSAALRRRAEAVAPRLRAACSEALRVYLAAHYRAGRTPDADRIAQTMQEAVDAVLGGPGATLLLSLIVVHGE